RRFHVTGVQTCALPISLCFVSADFEAALNDLGGKLAQIEAVMDLDSLRKEVAELEEEAARPDLWNDPAAAQKVTSQLSHKQASLRKVSELRQRVDDLAVLHELAEAEGDAASRSEAEAELEGLSRDIDALEVRTLLSGEYDE